MNAPVDVSFFARAAKPLTSYRKYWAARFGTAKFLPTTRQEMEALGWDSCDVVIDHHEQRDVDRRGHVQPEQRDAQHVDQGRQQHREHALELLAVDEDLGVAVLAQQRLVEDADARDRDDRSRTGSRQPRRRACARS